MNRGRIIKVVAVALLISMVFPLIVAAQPPPPGEPSPLSPVIMPNESFEGWAFPPSGWKVIQTNANETWKQITYPYAVPASGLAGAYVLGDAANNPQDEVLLTPKFYAPMFAVLYSTTTYNVTTCGPVDGVCDLEVWLVRGAWDAGVGNDVLLTTVDGTWTASGAWLRGGLAVSLETAGIFKPVRIGFRYKGSAGAAAIGLDDIAIIGYGLLTKNWSFERGGKLPTSWKGKNLTAKDKRDNSVSAAGSWSFKMVGSSAKKSLFQTIKSPGYANDTFTFLACSKSKNAKAGRPYEAVVTLYHRDGSKQRHKIKFSPGTHPWQCPSKIFSAKENYKKIQVEIHYWKQRGKAWFDLLYLLHP